MIKTLLGLALGVVMVSLPLAHLKDLGLVELAYLWLFIAGVLILGYFITDILIGWAFEKKRLEVMDSIDALLTRVKG